MIRVSIGKPHLYREQDIWDRDGIRAKGRWTVPDWYWITEDRWAAFDAYQQPLPFWPSVTRRELEQLIIDKMKASGHNTSLLWQFNLERRDGGFVRWVLAMGLDAKTTNVRMFAWSWADCYIRRPICLLVAWLRNRCSRN